MRTSALGSNPLRALGCGARKGGEWLLITEFIKEDSPFCLTRAITRTMIGPCYTPLREAQEGTLPSATAITDY